MAPVLWIVVPCYYDETVLPFSSSVFLKKIDQLIDSGKISDLSAVLFVNDGSKDKTWEIIKDLHLHSTGVKGLNLKKNYGEQNAILAGLRYSLPFADCTVSMDSDLQDDIDSIDEMLRLFCAGSDIVLGVRSDRKQDSVKERFFSGCFYFIMTALKTGLVKNHSNFRLLSRRAAQNLLEEKNAYFLPAKVCSMDYPTEVVFYARKAREHGTSGYNLRKKTELAVRAIFLHAPDLRKYFLFGVVGSAMASALLAAAEIRTGRISSAGIVLSCAFLIAFLLSAFLYFRYPGVLSDMSEQNRPDYDFLESTDGLSGIATDERSGQ